MPANLHVIASFGSWSSSLGSLATTPPTQSVARAHAMHAKNRTFILIIEPLEPVREWKCNPQHARPGRMHASTYVPHPLFPPLIPFSFPSSSCFDTTQQNNNGTGWESTPIIQSGQCCDDNTREGTQYRSEKVHEGPNGESPPRA